MNNLKDKATTTCMWIVSIAGTVLLLDKYLHFNEIVLNIAGVAMTLAGAVIAKLVGKNPDGSTKTPEQIEALNKKDPDTCNNQKN